MILFLNLIGNWRDLYYNQIQLIMEVEEDSFQQCKKQLEQDLGISSLPSPQKPMNSYMRYYFERSAQERSKGQINIKELSSKIAQQWKTLSPKKKDFYQQIYQIRLRQYRALLAQFELLSNQRKVLTPYSRFIKKRYLQYSKEYKNLSVTEVTKLANEDWKALSVKQKDKLQCQFQTEKNDVLLDIDRSDQIKEYDEKLKRYHDLLEEDKQKILRKYGLSPQNLARMKNQHKEKQAEMTKILREERSAFKKEQKKQYRESKKQQEQEERNRLRLIKEEQRQKEKEILKMQRLKINAQKEAKRMALRQIKAIQKQLQEIGKQSVPKDLLKEENVIEKKEVKTKKIKKAEVKNVVKKSTHQIKGKRKESFTKKIINGKIRRTK